jgi:hypothetical protein
VGGVTPPMGLLAARHAAQARGEAGMINKPRMITATGQRDRNAKRSLACCAPTR